MKMTTEQKKRWAQGWLATATKRQAGVDVAAFWQGIIDACDEKIADNIE